MSELAVECIRKNIERYNQGEDASFLDLGNCGLTEIPEILELCTWVKKINFSQEWWEFDFEATIWEKHQSQNNGNINDIVNLSSALSNLKNLTYLIISHSKVSDLALLSDLRNLEFLDCSYSNDILDLMPLCNLSNLRFIECSHTQVSDLSPLNELTNLQLLSCRSTNITNISPLENLGNIRILRLENTYLSDLTPLEKISKLQVLYCSGTYISDLSPISSLSNLRALALSSTQVHDITPISGLTKLEHLDFDSREISDLNAIVNLVNLQFLYCSGSKINDLTPIAKMINLRVLECSNTRIFDLEPIKNLVNIQILNCDKTEISDLSPLNKLTELQDLYCSDTLVSDLSPLSNLINLQTLSCYNTQVEDLSAISSLVNLESLSIHNTKVSDLAPLTCLFKLQTLYFYGTKVFDLSSLVNLSNLQKLYCSDTEVSNLLPLSNLINLQELDCSYTNVSDLSPLSNLINLRYLYCQYTLISDLSPLIYLRYLENIYCYNTNVSDLTQMVKLSDKKIKIKWSNSHEIQIRNKRVLEKLSIFVLNTPLTTPPIEIAQKSPEAVSDYFAELGDDGSKLNEVKIIFLGEASAGKTSLVKCLVGEDFDDAEDQTHGIHIRIVPFQMDDGEMVSAHIWDFGGQEIMHATHQFFLSQRCIYVLLLNSRNEDQAEKWLKHAASFGGKSPVLVVLNKIDENPAFEVNRKNLLEKYPAIREFFRISVKTKYGINAFRESLRREINNATTRCTRFPKNWLKVKEFFLNMEEDYIESSKYREVCEQMGVTRLFSQDVLLRFLHDLGVLINFRNLKFFDTQILNPLWLTNGVYRIINSELVANSGGILQEQDFDAVINDPRYYLGNTTDRIFNYPPSKLHYIVRVMEEFELCYAIDSRTYVIPQLLPVQESEFSPQDVLLHFIMHFPDFMPDSLFPRLVVKLHSYISGNKRWRTGFIFEKISVFQATARVRWDKVDQKILIDITGNDRLRLLSFIRETVKEIVVGFTDLDPVELVPIPGAIKEMKRYSMLVAMEKAGKKVVFSEELAEDIPLASLLDGIEEPSMRNRNNIKPIKAFISYSHKDQEYLRELTSALSPLTRLDKLILWCDRDIDAGDEWEKMIFDQLNEADIILCLVSSDFISSTFCYSREFTTALEAHRTGEKIIIPIMLRETDWEGLPLAQIQAIPDVWITSYSNRDQAWTRVSQKVRLVVDDIKLRRSNQKALTYDF